jgi:hypothetical protein
LENVSYHHTLIEHSASNKKRQEKKGVYMAQPMPTQQHKMTRQAPRPEMWLIMLAKSKTMRFFAVSCEFVIFLGCLWLTLVTILPDATGWLWGGVDAFFMVAMGFAVDAALPEAWLHVVDQWAEKKNQQLLWSIPIAIAMLLLVVANVVYTKLAGRNGAPPSGTTEALVNTLLIARMFIGICYVTIRECQSFIDRKDYHQQFAQPLTSTVAIEELVGKAINDLAEKQEASLRRFADAQQQTQDLLRMEQQHLLERVQVIEANVPRHDDEARAILSQLKAMFEGQIRAIVQESQGPDLERRCQLEARIGTIQSQDHPSGPPMLTLLASSKREAEMPARANGTPDERLQAAYGALVEERQRISGRALAKLAHINRETASRWLAEIKGQQEEPEILVEASCEIEGLSQSQKQQAQVAPSYSLEATSQSQSGNQGQRLKLVPKSQE